MENLAIWDTQERVIFKGRIIELGNRLTKTDTGKKRICSDSRGSSGG